MTPKQSIVTGGCIALLALSLYSTSRYELHAITDSIATSWKTTAASPQRTKNETSVVQLWFHLNHSALSSTLSSSTVPKFPRWPDTGIDITTILDFIFQSSIYADHPRDRANSKQNVTYIPTSDHATDVGYWYPEILYLMDTNGIWCSQRHRNVIIHDGKGTVKQKLEPTERFMIAAWRRLLDKNNDADRWPKLVESLEHQGVPFLAFYGDFTGCNRLNWQNTSIPLFTTAAAVDCKYAFPFPNYQTIKDAANATEMWDEAFRMGHARYPWQSKIEKVVWRGSLTGNVLNETHRSTRWAVLERIHQTEDKAATVFDVQATRLPKRHEGANLDLSSVGGIGEGFRNMEDFQKYKAILDMDGNSWSSRFGKLMCFNSVVLKMKPQFVDYFFFDLHPWVHYIPVADADDLMDKAKFALDPSNADQVRAIILEANAWCRRRMVYISIVEDMLDIWESYVKLLDAGSVPGWQTEVWTEAKALIRQVDSPLDMQLLPTDVGH